MHAEDSTISKVAHGKQGRQKQSFGKYEKVKSETNPNYSNSSKPTQSKEQSGKKKCFRCGRFHNNPATCPAINWTCFNCNVKGHSARICSAKKSVRQLDELDDSEDMLGYLKVLSGNSNQKLIEVEVNNKVVKFEVDTGACCTVMSKSAVKDFGKLEVSFRDDLKSVTGDVVKVIGSTKVDVSYGGRNYSLDLVILDSERMFTPLMGRDWLDVIFPEWRNCFENLDKIDEVGSQENSTKSERYIERFKNTYPNVF